MFRTPFSSPTKPAIELFWTSTACFVVERHPNVWPSTPRFIKTRQYKKANLFIAIVSRALIVYNLIVLIIRKHKAYKSEGKTGHTSIEKYRLFTEGKKVQEIGHNPFLTLPSPNILGFKSEPKHWTWRSQRGAYVITHSERPPRGNTCEISR